MPTENVRIFPLGDSALTVEFGNEISEELNLRSIGLANYLNTASFPGLIEACPAYSSTTIFYDPVVVRNAFPNFQTAFEAVKSIAVEALEVSSIGAQLPGRLIEIPVRFNPEFGLDLNEITKKTGFTTKEFISIFTGRNYRVYMLGFLPGFAYMGDADERIAVPRRESPRVKVPKGSVGIAGRQTGIYSFDSPGGWQIIGRTDVELFSKDGGSLLMPGDEVRFLQA